MTVNMGNVWDRATEFLSDNLSVIVPVALVGIVLPDAVSTIIAPLGPQSSTATAVVGVIGLALSLVALWGQLAIVALAIDPPAGRQAAVRRASARFLPMIGVSLVLLLGFTLLILPIPIILALSGYDVQAAMNGAQVEVPTAAGGFVALYALVLLPVLFFIAARMALLTPVIVAERLGLGAVRRSFDLTRGIVWKVIGVMILYGIVFGVALLAARTVFGSILELLVGGEGVVSAATVLTAIVVSVVQAVFVVLAAAFVAKLYLTVRDARGTIDTSL